MPLKCTRCGRGDAVYVRQYSGEKLCKRCFCYSIENKVRTTIARYSMFRFDDKIAVGVSGGKDSMALMSILSGLESSFTKSEIFAVTVDEGIGGYREEALRIARAGCRRCGVDSVHVSFEKMFGLSMDELVKKLREKSEGGGPTPCAYCGVLRRRALNIAARSGGATKLATAHNLDDETQTPLLSFFRGDPTRMARTAPVSLGTNARFVCRVKPFCEILEKEISMYDYLKGIDFQNAQCPYAALSLRSDIRTMLNRLEERHPGMKYAAYHSAQRLRPLLTRIVGAERLGRCKICGEPSVNQICQPCDMLRGIQVS